MTLKANHQTIKAYEPSIDKADLNALIAAAQAGHMGGAGPIGRRVEKLLQDVFAVKHVLLTPSCTAALEMAMILLHIGPGDEVIMPSFNYVSSANSVLLRGAVPVFADICDDTFNLDPEDVEKRITSRTKAIIPMHYGGVSCNMTAFTTLVGKHDLFLIEDAAQAVDACYKGQYLGTFGAIGCYSFHATKNIVCGEGGAFLTNDSNIAHRADILHERGTNRSDFLRGVVDEYTWVDVGSSYVLSDLLAALLESQLARRAAIKAKRKLVYEIYNTELSPLAESGVIRLPVVPKECDPNYHLYPLRTTKAEDRDALIQNLRSSGIPASFHYVPLHTSPFGRSIAGYDPLPITEQCAKSIVRLPIGAHITADQAQFVASQVRQFFG